jgi:hypothetical protein
MNGIMEECFPKTNLRSIPVRIRLEIYQDVISLRNKGLNTTEIKNEIFKEHGVFIRTNALYRWITNRSKACNQQRIFIPKPSRELSYLIGVFLGDGSIKIEASNYKYCFTLQVKDKEFAEKFSSYLSKILNKSPPYPVSKVNDFTRGKRVRFYVRVSNRMLYEFLSSPIEKLLMYAIFPTEFLRGIFDSDGFTSISAKNYFSVGVGVCGVDLELINFIKLILYKHFRINSTISKSMKKGDHVIIWGKEYTANKDVFVLSINNYDDVKNFCNFIGFSIDRKQEKLKEAIFIKDNFKEERALKIWKSLYFKQGREWVKIKKDSGASPELSSR